MINSAALYCEDEKFLERIPYNLASHMMLGDEILYDGYRRKVIKRCWNLENKNDFQILTKRV